MNRFKQHRLLVLSVVAYAAGIGLAALIWFLPAGAQAKAIKSPPNQPSEGWVICEDLGVGTVPYLPDLRQRFRLCHDDGWEYLVYCLDPGYPTPPLGSVCREIGEGLFDCGGNTQRLRLYRVEATPPPPPPPRTRTPTPTATQTPTPTRRVVSPPPRTPTVTVTPEEPCEPPEVCQPVDRPRPGGRGNLIWLGLLALSITGLVGLQGRLVFAGRRKK